MDVHFSIAKHADTSRRKQLNLFKNCSLVKYRMVVMYVTDRVRIKFQSSFGEVCDGFDTRSEYKLFIIKVVVKVLESVAVGAYDDAVFFYVSEYK